MPLKTRFKYIMDQIAGFYFCHCPDMQLAKEYMEKEYISSFGDAWIQAERHTFWTEDIQAYLSALDTISFETKNKILYIKNSHELSLEQWKKISVALGKPRADILSIFFLNNALEKGKLKVPQNIQKLKCYEFAKKKEWIFESVGITDKNFEQILCKEAAEKYGISLNHEVIAILKDILSPDYSSINNILAQLNLIKDKDGTVNAGALAQLTNYTPELVWFDIINKIEAGKSAEVWKLFYKASNQIDDSSIFAFLALMMREMRILWKIKAKEQVFLPTNQISNKTNIALKLGFTNIAKIISLLCFADFAVKSGKKKSVETLEELIKDCIKIFTKDTNQLSTLYTINTEN